MNRRLLVINPNQCIEVQFDQQLTIGRDVYNSLCLQDAEISRSHAIIFEQERDVIIKDLKSRNGIYVNGEKVAEKLLKPGDELIIGATVLLYEPKDSEDLGAMLSKRGRFLIDKRSKEPVTKGPEEPVTMFTCAEMDAAIQKLLSDGEGEKTTFLSLTNVVKILQALRAMDAAADARQLCEKTLEQAVAIIGAHRGVIMETDAPREHLKVRALRAPGGGTTIAIGDPILRVLLESEKCLFCPNVVRDKRFAKMAAKSEKPLHAFIACPIRAGDEMFGFIYLDAEDTSINYDYAALRSLYLVAAHAGALMRQRPLHFAKQRPAEATPPRVAVRKG